MEFATFDDDLFVTPKPKSHPEPTSAAEKIAGPAKFFEANQEEPYWFLPTGRAPIDARTSLGLDQEIDLCRHRAAHAYLMGNYADALTAYESALHLVNPKDRSQRLELLESIARCCGKFGRGSAQRNGASAVTWALRFLATGTNLDHELQACYLIADISSQSGMESEDETAGVGGAVGLSGLSGVSLLHLIHHVDKNPDLWVRLGRWFDAFWVVDFSCGDGKSHRISSVPAQNEPGWLLKLNGFGDGGCFAISDDPRVRNLETAISAFEDTILRWKPAKLRTFALACWIRAQGLVEASRKAATPLALEFSKQRHAVLSSKLNDCPVETLMEIRGRMCSDILRLDELETQQPEAELTTDKSCDSGQSAANRSSFRESVDVVLDKWFAWIDDFVM